MKPKKKIKKEEKTRKEKFIENFAKTKDAYNSCVEAGYSPKYAKTYAHKLRDKYETEIEKLKPIVEAEKIRTLKEEINYSVKDCFNEFNEVLKLAMLQDHKGNFSNLNAANKAIENKGRLVGAFEVDNSQKMPENLFIKVISKEEEN